MVNTWIFMLDLPLWFIKMRVGCNWKYYIPSIILLGRVGHVRIKSPYTHVGVIYVTNFWFWINYRDNYMRGIFFSEMVETSKYLEKIAYVIRRKMLKVSLHFTYTSIWVVWAHNKCLEFNIFNCRAMVLVNLRYFNTELQWSVWSCLCYCNLP